MKIPPSTKPFATETASRLRNVLRRAEIYSRAGNECNITLRSDLVASSKRVSLRSIGSARIEQSVVNFYNCQVKTTKLSEDLDQLIVNVNAHKRQFKNFSDSDDADIKEFNKLRYLKGEDDFEVVSAVSGKVYRS
uniref:Uncharacterized protein n=1 Tax=Trichogramma kaykai TaxID=54128 RepID=A0ABD2VWS6_9HYME